MRKLILQMQASIDGYISRPDGGLDWLIWDFSDNWAWDDELKKEFNAICQSIDCILLSGKMAGEGYIDHWTAMSIKHAKDPLFAFTKEIAAVQKVIFSKTFLKVHWDNAILAKYGLEEEIAALKAKPGKDIIAFGGASFAGALLKARVVDELQLFINPQILGNGISIFTNAADSKLHLISTQGFKCGVSILRYSIKSRGGGGMSLQKKKFVITGATNDIGKVIVKQLTAAGHLVTEVSRTVGISIDNEKKLNAAFENADGAYLMIPFDMEATDLHAREEEMAAKLCNAIETNKVPRVVCLSGANAYLKFGTSLGASLLEDRLNTLNIPELVHLRCGFFMENFIKGMSFVQQSASGSFSTPFYGDRPTPMIATKDIAVTAAAILLNDTFHEPRERELLGAMDYTMREATRILGAAIGKSEITYHQASYDEATAGMITAGLSLSFTEAVIETAKSFNKGERWALEKRSPANTTDTTLEIFASQKLKAVFYPIKNENR